MTRQIRLLNGEMQLEKRSTRIDLEIDITENIRLFIFDVYASTWPQVHPDLHLGWWEFPLEQGSYKGCLTFDLRGKTPQVTFETKNKKYAAENFWFNEDYNLQPLQNALFVLRDHENEIVEIKTITMKIMDQDLLTDYYRQLHKNGQYSQATGSNPFLSTLHNDKMKILMKMMHKYFPAGGRILDAGCGLSIIPRLFQPVPYKLVCADIGFAIIHQQAVANPGIHWTVADIQDMPYPDTCFDGILCGEVIEHIHKPKDALLEWKRVLKPQGKLILTTPNRARISNRFNKKSLAFAPDHVSEKSLKEWLELLESTGFNIEKTTGLYLELWLNYFEEKPWVDLFQKRYNRKWIKPFVHVLNHAGRLYPGLSLDLIIVASRSS